MVVYQRTEVRRQRPEGRGQKTEVRSQRTETLIADFMGEEKLKESGGSGFQPR
jgi:hypothetical protein